MYLAVWSSLVSFSHFVAASLTDIHVLISESETTTPPSLSSGNSWTPVYYDEGTYPDVVTIEIDRKVRHIALYGKSDQGVALQELEAFGLGESFFFALVCV